MFSKNSKSTTPFFLVAATMFAIFAWQAGANSSRPPAQPTAVATIDIVSVIDQLKERIVRESELEANQTTRQAQLQEVADRIKILQSDIEAGTAGTGEYNDKIRQAMEIQAVYKARGEALNQILSIDRGNVTREMYEKMQDAITRIADREGYDIVLFDDSLFSIPQNAMFPDVYRSIVSRSVIYRHASADITDQVVTLMNNEFAAP